MEIETELFVARRIEEMSTHFKSYTAEVSHLYIRNMFDEFYGKMERTLKLNEMEYSSKEIAALILEAIEESFEEKYTKRKDIVH